MTSVYNIYPTLFQCFGIILVGYLTGRLKFITTAGGKGISLFISNIALPALIFKAMVEVKFAAVDWLFWCALLISKAVVFLLVFIVTLIFQKTDRFGAAGLYSIFVSQSNDIAFGLPLLSTVFSKPDVKSMVDYVFLAAPISLAILNPIGFAFLEYQKAINARRNSHSHIDMKKVILVTMKALITNPLVFMILFGIIGNFIFHQKVPHVVDSLFACLGNAFSATALFYLGWRLGCQQMTLHGLQFSVPIGLVLVKGIFLPIIMVRIVCLVTGKESYHHNSSSLVTNSTTHQTYAFLYGAIPTAPTVLLYAAKYNMFEEIVGSGLIMGTLLSAPVIFASIKMIEVQNLGNIEQFTGLIGNVCKIVSIISIVCCIYVLVVLLILRKYKRTPHLYTMAFISSQLLVGVMGCLYASYLGDITRNKTFLFFLYLGLFGCPLWCAMIGIALSMIATRRESVIEKWKLWTLLLPFGVLVAMCAIFVLTTGEINTNDNHYFLVYCYKKQLTLTIMYMVLNVVALLSCFHAFVCLKRSDFPFNNNEAANNERYKKMSFNPNEETPMLNDDAKSYGSAVDESLAFNSVQEMESVRVELSQSNQYHLTHHVVLLLIMVAIMIVNLGMIIWENAGNDNRGLLLELQMLSVCLIYGQGFFSFAIFGFLKEFLSLPMFESHYKKCLSCQGRQKIVLDDEMDLPSSTLLQCKKFIKHHMRKCSDDIVTSLRFRFKTYEDVFDGRCLVDWLIEAGLATDRGEAVALGNNLLQGRVIEHCLQEHFFYDLPYFYQFTRTPFEPSVERL